MDYYKLMAQNYDLMKTMQRNKLNFFQSIFRQYNHPYILDCACGTGYDMNVFKKCGYDIVGSDISDSMLAIAKERFNDEPNLINKVNFEELHTFYKKKFDVILCLSNAINEVHVNPAKALNSMKKVLRPGGCIIFDQGQTDAMMEHPPHKETVVDTSAFSRVMTMSYQDNRMTIDIEDTIKNINKVMSSQIQLEIRLQKEWEQILDTCNLDYVMYGDFSGTKYDTDTSKRLIIVARNKGD